MVIGPARAQSDGDISAALDAARELVQNGAKPRAAARVVAKLTGMGANALYRALTE